MMPMIPIAADLGYMPPTIHDVDYYGKHSPTPGRTLWTVMRSRRRLSLEGSRTGGSPTR